MDNDYEIIHLDKIKDYIDESSPIYEDVLYINREELNYTPMERADIIECLRILNERGNGSEFILNTVADRFAKTGKMDLTGMDLDINSSDDIVALSKVLTKPNYTYVFFLNARHRHIATIQYDNIEFNDKNIFRRIRNDGKDIGAVYAYLYTDSEEIYFEASAYTKHGNLFVDVILKNDGVYKSSQLHRKGPVYRGEWLGLSDVNNAKITKL